jgi:hypothetical protein
VKFMKYFKGGGQAVKVWEPLNYTTDHLTYTCGDIGWRPSRFCRLDAENKIYYVRSKTDDYVA